MSESEKQLQVRLREIEQLKQKIEKENLYLREEVSLLFEHGDIVCESAVMKTVLAQVEQVARTDSTVLITGETGTGKELLAREIHNLSSRNERPLVTVNCASLPPTLIESELFGREKGAYTGAMTRMAGRFEVADGSTIFLDEIAELPLDLQSKLLRVIEEGTFERLGSTRTIHVNVRIIAATNRDLSQEVRAGRFPARPVLPAERVPHNRPAPPRARRRTFRPWSGRSSASSRRRWASRSRTFRSGAWRHCSAIPGPGTSGSSGTSSSTP